MTRIIPNNVENTSRSIPSPPEAIEPWRLLSWSEISEGELVLDQSSGSNTISEPDSELYSLRWTANSVEGSSFFLWQIPITGFVKSGENLSFSTRTLMSDPSVGAASSNDTILYFYFTDENDTNAQYVSLSSQGRRGYGPPDVLSATTTTNDINSWFYSGNAGTSTLAPSGYAVGLTWDASENPSLERSISARCVDTSTASRGFVSKFGTTKSTSGAPLFLLGFYPNLGSTGAYRDLAIYIEDRSALGLSTPN